MSEDRATVYANAAGLLSRMGYAARVEPAHAVAQEPEAHLPETSRKAGRVPLGKAGDPQWAWWA